MRLNYIIKFLIVIISLYVSSCGIMRSIGLYNAPPPYSETYEEYFHKKCIDHPNKKENISIKLRSLQETFSPYENIQISISVVNSSPIDTMYVYSVDVGNLSISDSFNRPTRILEGYTNACPWIIVNDEYGRKLISTILSEGLAIPPKDSLYKTISFITGLRLPDAENFPEPVISRATFQRENFPGTYKIVLITEHQEFDEWKGFVDAGKIYSDTIRYGIRDYTEDEKEIRKDIVNIIRELQDKKPQETTDSLIAIFGNKYSKNDYLKQISEYQHIFYQFDSLRASKTNTRNN